MTLPSELQECLSRIGRGSVSEANMALIHEHRAELLALPEEELGEALAGLDRIAAEAVAEAVAVGVEEAEGDEQ